MTDGKLKRYLSWESVHFSPQNSFKLWVERGDQRDKWEEAQGPLAWAWKQSLNVDFLAVYHLGFLSSCQEAKSLGNLIEGYYNSNDLVTNLNDIDVNPLQSLE